MSLRSIARRIRARFGGRALDAALDEEVRGHLELLAAEYEGRGLSRDQARLAARRAFGGIEQMKETHRDARRLPWLDDARRDIHQALRALRRAPVFTGAAVLTLAVGLTAVTGIFAVLNAFMLRAMPVSHPEQLVSIGTGPDAHVQIGHGVSFVDLQDYRKDHDTFEDLLAYSVAIGGLTSDNTTERITMYGVTDNYFSLLGVQPAIGRLIQPNEGRARGRPGEVRVEASDAVVSEFDVASALAVEERGFAAGDLCDDLLGHGPGGAFRKDTGLGRPHTCHVANRVDVVEAGLQR